MIFVEVLAALIGTFYLVMAFVLYIGFNRVMKKAKKKILKAHSVGTKPRSSVEGWAIMYAEARINRNRVLLWPYLWLTNSLTEKKKSDLVVEDCLRAVLMKKAEEAQKNLEKLETRLEKS